MVWKGYRISQKWKYTVHWYALNYIFIFICVRTHPKLRMYVKCIMKHNLIKNDHNTRLANKSTWMNSRQKKRNEEKSRESQKVEIAYGLKLCKMRIASDHHSIFISYHPAARETGLLSLKFKHESQFHNST